jgi:hypothetical protein
MYPTKSKDEELLDRLQLDDEDDCELEVRELDVYEFMTGTRTRKTEDE